MRHHLRLLCKTFKRPAMGYIALAVFSAVWILINLVLMVGVIVGIWQIFID